MAISDTARPAAISQALRAARSRHIAVHIVANGVRGDSRVVKSARASIDAGLPTMVLGIALTAHHEYFEVEGVPVLLIPSTSSEQDRAAVPERRDLQFWKRRERDVAVRRVARAARSLRLRELGRALRVASGHGPERRWSEARPSLLDINIALARALDELQPRMIHAHDAHPLPAAVTHAARERLRRRRVVEVIYDAHECIPELAKSYPDSPLYTALSSIEREYVRDASQVLAVSPQIAVYLKKHYGLRAVPTAVENGPVGDRDRSAPDLRDLIGVGPDTPLAVYSGWVAPERGVDTVIRAMTIVPELHLALVVGGPSDRLLAVLKLAHTLDVLDRVHTAPYVAPSQVTQYLSSADLGLIPLKPGGHLDLSLPTKFREYAHAGLPMVVSNHKAMAAEIDRTEIGLVFKAGNVSGLALQIERVLASPDRYRDRLTPELLAEYAWEAQADKLRAIYARFVREGDTIEPDLARLFVGVEVPTESTSTTRPTAPDHDGPYRPEPRLYGVKLGIGRTNSAGQAHAWAAAVSRHLRLPAESFAPVDPHRPQPDVAVRRNLNIQQGALELGRIASQYSHLLIDGCASLLGPLMEGDLEREIQTLRPHLLGLGLVVRARDVRDRNHDADSSVSRSESDDVEESRSVAERNRAIVERFDGPVFVASPDLLHDLPGAHWLPVVVDPTRWAGLAPAAFGRRLRVLHQPDRSALPNAGTDVIHSVLEHLDAEGVIDLIRLDGAADVDDPSELVARCDVLVDHTPAGSYGIAAVEALLAGRIVVGSVSPDVRLQIGEDVPIVEAPPDEFEEVVRRLAETDRNELRTMAAAGRDYALHLHDGRRSAQTVFDALLAPVP